MPFIWSPFFFHQHSSEKTSPEIVNLIQEELNGEVLISGQICYVLSQFPEIHPFPQIMHYVVSFSLYALQCPHCLSGISFYQPQDRPQHCEAPQATKASSPPRGFSELSSLTGLFQGALQCCWMLLHLHSLWPQGRELHLWQLRQTGFY